MRIVQRGEKKNPIVEGSALYYALPGVHYTMHSPPLWRLEVTPLFMMTMHSTLRNKKSTKTKFGIE